MAAGPVPPVGRVLGIDLGTVRIGVAVCDAGRILASPLMVVSRSGRSADDHQRLAELAREEDAVGLVVGLPVSLDGSLGPAARAALEEIRALGVTTGLPIDTYDERLTTVTAEQQLAERGITGPAAREVVDQVAAAVILQGWLDKIS